MKRMTTKEILAASFREIAERKNIEKITVKDIVENCGYSPATFYRHFRDKYDLIAWDYVQESAVIMGKIGGDYHWRETLLDGAVYYWENRDYIKNLCMHTSGHNTFIKYMAQTNIAMLKAEVEKGNGGKAPDTETQLLINTYCLGTVALVIEWISGNIEATPQEMAVAFEDALPEKLKKCLY
ncbi:MAG: TetR/AcrR family transcriptional regulator C-terminal domain-containing protein [Eubacterium sp.]|nr:TetR/AcrR family transcriptional regulator C-terminal domain-containing protein [Eubacterium sp.]